MKRILTSVLLVMLLLGAILPTFVAPQPVYASTETLRPNAAGDETAIENVVGSDTHWEAVDDVSPDDTTTYVLNGSTAYQRDLYNLPAHSGDGAINSVTIYFRCKKSAAYAANAKPSLKTNGTVYDGTAVSLSSSFYQDFSQTWNTNPQTEAAWTWDEIDALQVGVSLIGYTGLVHADCTQVYVVVDYTLPPAPSVTTNAASSVEETIATLNGEVTVINDSSITQRGFVWDTSTHGAPGNVAPASSGYANNWTEMGSYGADAFTYSLGTYTEGELYYVRACAKNDLDNWAYGDEVTFLTKPDPPSTFTATATGEDQIDLAWANGDGADKVYIRGKLGSAPTNRTDGAYSWDGTGTTTSHTGLSVGQHWYYIIWSYATEGGLTQYSDTPDLDDDATTVNPPTVASLMVEGTGSDEYGCWVILRGQVTDDEGLTIDTIGFEYGLTAGYGSDVSDSGDWDTGDDFVLRIGGLAHGTTYHWRAYATDGAVYGYGDDMVFTTVGSPSLYEYWNTGQDGDSSAIYAGNWAAEYFTVGSESHSVVKIRAYLKRVGSPGEVTVSIRHADDAYKPTGVDICSGTYDGDVLATGYNMIEVIVDEASFEAGTAYAVVVRAVAGDGSNYVLWGKDAGGGLPDAYGWHSTDGGTTWSSDSPAEYLFELWGYPLLSIEGGAVFGDYLEDGDMLFTLQYINIYAPYYSDYDCPTYFSIRLYDTDGVTLLKSTACWAWGNKPGSIYVAAEEASALTADASYYLKLVLNPDTDVVASYQLQASNWKGTDLMGLDRWCITTAHSIETYYYDIFGQSIDLTTIGENSEILNEDGGVLFITGIPGLDQVRPDLFEVTVSQEGYTPSTGDVTYTTSRDWEAMVGATVADFFNAGGDFVNIDGKDFGGFLILLIYIFAACFLVPKGGAFVGDTVIGAGLALPCIFIGNYLGLVDIIYLAVPLSALAFALVYSIWWSRT